jgi:hypothetical protein
MNTAATSAANLNAQFRSAHQLVVLRTNSSRNFRDLEPSPQQRGARSSQQPGLSTECRAYGKPHDISRRAMLGAAAVSVGLGLLPPVHPAQAGLVQFPCAELKNKYILIRAGESYSESQDTILTNPAWKTSMAAGLSDRGKAQVVTASLSWVLDGLCVLLQLHPQSSQWCCARPYWYLSPLPAMPGQLCRTACWGVNKCSALP